MQASSHDGHIVSLPHQHVSPLGHLNHQVRWFAVLIQSAGKKKWKLMQPLRALSAVPELTQLPVWRKTSFSFMLPPNKPTR